MIERFVAGIVGGPFGVKGQFKVWVPSGETDHLECLESLTLRRNGVERSYIKESSGGSPDNYHIKLKGIESPEEALTLKGAEILVGRKEAAPLYEDEYYIEDMKGLTVVHQDAEGRDVPLGTVRDVLDGGGGQLIEVALAAGKLGLVPFRSEFVGEVDLERRTLQLLETWILE